jgi:hypothetical protein
LRLRVSHIRVFKRASVIGFAGDRRPFLRAEIDGLEIAGFMHELARGSWMRLPT